MTNGFEQIMTTIGPVLYWATVLLAVMVSLCLAVVASRIGGHWWVLASSVALGLAIILVVIPTPPASVLFDVLLTIAALALAVIGGGPAVLSVLSLAERGGFVGGGAVEGAHGGIFLTSPGQTGTSAAATLNPNDEVMRGGTTIGYLERLAVAGTVIGGFPAAIAVVVAIKSVGRFSELNAAQSTQRFIIGTMTSLIWACACAGVVYFAVR